MAGLGGKTYPLSIVVGTVDRATASFERINKQINRLTAPVRRLNNRLGALKRASGVAEIGEAWTKAGTAFGGVVGPVKSLAVGLLGIAGAAGLGLHSVLGLVEQSNALGETADRLGLTVDQYASLRGAAKSAGIENEALDASMESFGITLAKTRSGFGKFAGFLKQVSPALLKQVKATKNNEEAFLLMADAVQRVKDPAKQAALATAAFGGSGAHLVTLLKGGASGVKAAQAEFLRLAGSQEEAVKRARAADDALDALDQTMDGVKATIVTAFAPALKGVVDDLVRFLTGHRADIAAWAKNFGDRLPGAIATLRDGLVAFFGPVKKVWDFLGGASGIATIFAAAFGVKMVVALLTFGKALSALGLAGAKTALLGLLNPVGLVLVAIAAVAAIAFLVIKNWTAVKFFFTEMWSGMVDEFVGFFEQIDALVGSVAAGFMDAWSGVAIFFRDLWDGIGSIFDGIWKRITDKFSDIVAIVDKVKGFLGIDTGTATGAGQFPQQPGQVGAAIGAANVPIGGGNSTQTNDARVKVEFANLPAGARATTDPRSVADVDLSVGYQMVPG